MNYQAHLVAGITSGVCVSNLLELNPVATSLFIVSSAVFSLLPDIDTPKSYIGHKLKITSHIINKLFGHRNITHSLVIPTILLILSPLFGSGIIYGVLCISAYTGHISHILLDFLTPSGVPLLFPIRKWKFSLYNILKSR